MNDFKSKKSASDVLVEHFLKDVDERGSLPWQRPYERYDSFNYFSKKMYRGFNRLMLPFGEYMTKNQINQYNKDHGYLIEENGKIVGMKPEAYRFVKGIHWWPVVFFTESIKGVSKEELLDTFKDYDGPTNEGEDQYIGKSGGYYYFVGPQGFYKKRNILRYYLVADRKFFQNANGECLPSRIDTGDIVITKQEPMKVINNYIKRSGVTVDMEYLGIPNYTPAIDTVHLNPKVKDEDNWFSTAFHEFAHSTGSKNRLNREGVAKAKGDISTYAEEECIAEMAACLCCAETNVYDFRTSASSYYDNNLAYVQSWKTKIKDWGSKFIFLCSQADKAFNYICEGTDVLEEDNTEN